MINSFFVTHKTLTPHCSHPNGMKPLSNIAREPLLHEEERKTHILDENYSTTQFSVVSNGLFSQKSNRNMGSYNC